MKNKERQPSYSDQRAPHYGLEFATDDLPRAHGLAQQLIEKGPFEYDLVTTEAKDPTHKKYIMVVPRWSRDQLVPLLKTSQIPFRSRRVLPLSELSP